MATCQYQGECLRFDYEIAYMMTTDQDVKSYMQCVESFSLGHSLNVIDQGRIQGSHLTLSTCYSILICSRIWWAYF